MHRVVLLLIREPCRRDLLQIVGCDYCIWTCDFQWKNGWLSAFMPMSLTVLQFSAGNRLQLPIFSYNHHLIANGVYNGANRGYT